MEGSRQECVLVCIYRFYTQVDFAGLYVQAECTRLSHLTNLLSPCVAPYSPEVDALLGIYLVHLSHLSQN